MSDREEWFWRAGFYTGLGVATFALVCCNLLWVIFSG